MEGERKRETSEATRITMTSMPQLLREVAGTAKGETNAEAKQSLNRQLTPPNDRGAGA